MKHQPNILRRYCMLMVMALMAGPAWTADYQLIMPLQYNRYQPLDAEMLGGANSGALSWGPSSLFENPARTLSEKIFSIQTGAGFISGNQSHVLIRTRQALAFPAAVAAVFCRGRYSLGAGYWEPLSMDMSYPDQWQPARQYQVALGVRQFTLGGGYQISPGVAAGGSLNYLWSDISWSGGDTQIVAGRAEGYSLTAGIVIGISQEFSIFTQIRTEGELQGFTVYRPNPGSSLELYGMVPARSTLGAVYQVDSGLTVSGQLDITGWEKVSWDYQGRTDFRCSALWEVVPSGYLLRLGLFTMSNPMLNEQISLYPHLQGSTYVSAGQTFVLGPMIWTIAGATSRLFAGTGLKQDILALSFKYEW